MPNLQAPFWGRRTLCIITGASRGIGRQIAIEFSQKVKKNSVFILLARSLPGLQETRRLVLDASTNILVTCRRIDLMQTTPEELTRCITDAQIELSLSPENFELAMMVHNAGSIGDVTQKACEMADPKKWMDYMSLNLISVASLNSVFLYLFPAEQLKEVCILNITSMCGIQPFKSMGYYCVGKASREMYFRVLAEECPTLNVLSYSPGPVDTDMINEMIEKVTDEEVKQNFISYKENILSPEQTVKRCIGVLAGRKYKSGGRVDYFDDTY